jgi:hypothetical protein
LLDEERQAKEDQAAGGRPEGRQARRLLERQSAVQARLALLANDFVRTATHFAKIIIVEKNLAEEKRTIRSADIGGVAGGEKFVIHGIVFKFATRDSTRLRDTGDDLSDFLYPSDEIAMKAAAHDLKGLTAVFESTKRCPVQVRIPLMALVDYHGYRIQVRTNPSSSSSSSFSLFAFLNYY